MIHPACNGFSAFGLHTQNTFEKFSEKALDGGNRDPMLLAYNFSSLGGYFPLTGPVCGIGRIACAFVVFEDRPLSFKATLIARGVIECIGLGILFLIPDMIITIGRHLCKPSELFGYHSKASLEKARSSLAEDDEETPVLKLDKSPLYMNTLNAAGYLPIVGLVTGILRMNHAFTDKDQPLRARVSMGVRGAIECLGCGFLYLIPDILISIGRIVSNRLATTPNSIEADVPSQGTSALDEEILRPNAEVPA